jgi:putative copper resistance protein D
MTTVALVLARTLHFGSAMLLVALPYFILVILRPALATGASENYESFCRAISKWLWAAWLLEALSGLAWFWLVTAQMSDHSPWGSLDQTDLSAVLGQTQFGQVWLGRAVLGCALGVALFFASRGPILRSRAALILNWLVLVLGAVLLITLAWAGHAAAGIHFQVVHLIADTLHLFLGAIWPLGLLPMLGFLWYLRRDQPVVPSAREIQVLQRFSQSSLLAVLVLATTGMINGWLMVGSWAALVTTAYGGLLLGKVLVVAIMIVLGARNRFYLLPRLAAKPILFRALRRTILAESALALVVLLLVGTLGMTAPPS